MFEIKDGEDAIRWFQDPNFLLKSKYCGKRRIEIV